MFINLISSTTFGIYLIHDSDLFRHYLWKGILNTTRFYTSDHIIFHAVISVVVVFITCCLIEMARIFLLEVNYMPCLRCIANTVEKR